MTVQTSETMKSEHRPVFAAIGLAIGLAMFLAILGGMVGGKVHGWKAEIGMLIFLAIPICAIGTGLAMISLVMRRESKSLAQAALWLNGMITFFGFPLMVYWLISIA